MNIKKLAASAALMLSAGAVFAGDITPFVEADNFKSTKTRAEVQSEVLLARQAGELVVSDIAVSTVPAPTIAANARTRTEVRSEAIDYAKNHKAEKSKPVGG